MGIKALPVPPAHLEPVPPAPPVPKALQVRFPGLRVPRGLLGLTALPVPRATLALRLRVPRARRVPPALLVAGLSL